MINKVVVFGSAKSKDKALLQEAYLVGSMLAKQGYTVITGGGPSIMAEINRGAFEAGGESWGICINKKEEFLHSYFTHTEVYDDFPARHKRLLSLGDAFVVMPGGLGTLHETLEITQYKKFGIVNNKTPLILYSNFFENLYQFFQQLEALGFVETKIDSLIIQTNSPEQLINKLRS